MAKLAAAVPNLEAVPEPLRGLYDKGPDGSYVLQLEGTPPGFVPKETLAEFRNSNVALKTTLEAREAALAELRQQFDGIDPAAAREAITKAQAMADKKLLEKGDVDALIQQRVDAATKPLLSRAEAAEQARQKTEEALQRAVVDQGIVAAARRAGDLQPGAEAALVQAARGAGWTSVDGVLRQIEGGAVVYSRSKAGQVREIDEWVAEEGLTQLGWMWKGSNGTKAPAPAGAGARPTPPQGQAVDPLDREAFGANLEGIAKGKVAVGPLPLR